MTDNRENKNIHFFHFIPTLEGGGAEKVTLTYHRGLLKNQFSSTILILENKIDYDVSDVKDSIKVITKNKKLTHIKQLDERIIASKISKILKSTKKIPVLLVSLEEAYNIAKHVKTSNKIFVIQNSLQEKIHKWETLNPQKAKRHLKNFKQILSGSNIIGSSKGILSDLINDMGITPSNSELIYNPIDAKDILKKSNEYTPEIKNKYILHAARIHEQKRHDIMLEAYSLIKNKIDLVFLTNETKKLKNMIENHPKKDSIHIYGFQKNYFPWLKNASLFVLSSQREGLPTVLLDSLACKIPTVSTDCISGPSEILTGDLSNFLAKVNDPQSLADKIDLALTQYPEIGNNYILKFSQNEAVSKLLTFSKKVIKQNGPTK